MDVVKSSKQILSDARRREAIKQRQQEQANRQKQIAESLRNSDAPLRLSNKIVFHSDDEHEEEEIEDTQEEKSSNTEAKLTLFESSDSENEDHRFEIKKQFEGERGQKLFEISSAFTDERFKLDERFKESDEESTGINDSIENEGDRDEDVIAAEKEKNLEILERVLGFQVPKRPPKSSSEKNLKRNVRFDPENKDAAQFVKQPDPDEESKSKKAKTKKSKTEKAPEMPEPVVSSERYFEVVGNLKELLDNPDPIEQQFSFTHQFNFQNAEYEENEEFQKIDSAENKEVVNSTNDPVVNLDQRNSNQWKDNVEYPVETKAQKKTTFFVSPDDPRLTEGIENFRRMLPMQKIRENWYAAKEDVVAVLKRNRRKALKNPNAKPTSFQKVAPRPTMKRRFTKRFMKR